MTFTGLTTRYIADSSGVSFLLDGLQINAFDYYLFGGTSPYISPSVEFGFSGITGQNKLAFLFSGGKIYDPEGRNFYSFTSGEKMKFSGNIDISNYEYFLNDELICAVGVKDGYDLNAFYVNCSGGGGLTADISIASSTPDTDFYSYGAFTESGLWTGFYFNYGTTPIVIRSGQLFGADSIYFSTYSGTSFDSGNNIISGGLSGKIVLQQTSGATKTGIFTPSVRLYTDFGYEDLLFSGRSSKGFSIVAENSLQDLFTGNLNPSGFPNSGIKYFNYHSVVTSGSSKISKNIYISVDFTSGYTGNFTRITGYTFTNFGAGGYTLGKTLISGLPASSGFPMFNGNGLVNGSSIFTGITVFESGAYFSGSGPISMAFYPASPGGAAGYLMGSGYVKTYTGYISVITGAYGTTGAFMTNKTSTRYSGFTTMGANQEDIFIKVLYTPPYDTAPIYFNVSVSGYPYNNISTLTGSGIAFRV